MKWTQVFWSVASMLVCLELYRVTYDGGHWGWKHAIGTLAVWALITLRDCWLVYKRTGVI